MTSTRFDEDIWFLERVSLGASFELFLAFWPEENDKVLIKRVREDIDPDKKEEAEARLLKEAATLEEFWSPYFPKVYDIRRKEEDDTLYVIVQYFSGISLREYLNLHMEKKTITQHFIQNFILEMDYALDYLHNKKGIVHLDLSPDNIIITQNNKVRIIDFEDSRKIGSELDSDKLRGKEQYISPSLFNKIINGESAHFEARWDLYAYGVTLEELCHQTQGLEKLKTLKLRKKIKTLKRKDFSRSSFSIPKLQLPKLNFRYLGAALVSVTVLAMTITALEFLGKPSSSQRPKAIPSIARSPIAAPAEKVDTQTPKIKEKAKPIQPPIERKQIKKKVIAKVVPLPAVKPTEKAVTQEERPLESKAQIIAQKNLFKKEFKKLISKKDPYLKECMSYETSSKKKELSLSFHLAANKGRAVRIDFDPKLNQLTKSCLSALYADIIFPQHPSKAEVEIVQHFSFKADDVNDQVDESIFL